MMTHTNLMHALPLRCRRSFALLSSACVLSGLLVSGCAKPADKQQAVDLLFGSFQRIAEAKSMKASGTADLAGISLPYQFEFDNEPEIGIAIEATAQGQPVDFYVKDGRTYLNFLGTKSSSELSNLTGGNSNAGSAASLNPFLDLSREERMQLVDTVTVDNDVYTYTLNKSELSKAFDSFGTLTLTKAFLTASFNGEDLKTIDFTAGGTLSMDSESAPFDAHLTMNVDSMNENLTISYPDDLASWPVQ